jgi:hypothetical protein
MFNLLLSVLAKVCSIKVEPTSVSLLDQGGTGVLCNIMACNI